MTVKKITTKNSWILEKLNKNYLYVLSMLAILLFSGQSMKAQEALTNKQKTKKAYQVAKSATSTKKLDVIRSRAQQEMKKAHRIADEKGWKKKIVGRDGSVSILKGVYEINGGLEPVYLTNYNSGGSKGGSTVTGTKELWPDGDLGLDLTGEDLKLAIVDGGSVRSTHQEFGDRVTLEEPTQDLGDHATHVAGTMIAAGVNENAKGMAYKATLHSWSFYNGDDEVASIAKEFILSNHSYGIVAGWAYGQGRYGGGQRDWEWVGYAGQEEPYVFGWYSDSSQELDEIAYGAPYYLYVKAAGNSHDFSPYRYNFSADTRYYYRDAEGNNASGTIGTAANPARYAQDAYDNIGPAGVAKNVLTVGNVNYEGTSPVIARSSSWGGADDGRIKPDISTKGTDVYSAVSTGNAAYEEMTGTSMASPMTTGSLLLLQEHYKNIHSKFMRSATLKALVIQTADEAGDHEGPDYKYGWGLLNTKTAAETITESEDLDVIGEYELDNEGEFVQEVTVDGTEPLKVSIAWTDVAGAAIVTTYQEVHNNRTAMLVNDLDIRITKDGKEYLPYALNIEDPAAAAKKQDNKVDNVEQVYIAAPEAGTYTISVTHKGTLKNADLEEGKQNFSIIVSGAESTTVITPAADFVAESTTVSQGGAVNFIDQSPNAESWAWTFEGGTPATSTAKNPIVTYNTAGKYSVTLTITNTEGTDTKTETKYITVNEVISVTGVNLTPSTLTIGVGSTETLTATVLPANAENQAVTWSSSDESVAIVDKNGVVTGVALGTATVTVTTVDGGFTASSTVTVSDEDPHGAMALSAGTASTGTISRSNGSELWYIDVPAGTTSMRAVLNCQGADFDLFGRAGNVPTTRSYDWRGYTSGGEDETVSNPATGRHYILVNRYRGYGDYTLTVTFTLANGTTEELASFALDSEIKPTEVKSINVYEEFGVVNIAFAGQEEVKGVSVVSISGKVMYSSKSIKSDLVRVSDLTPGCYVVKVQNGRELIQRTVTVK